MWLQDQATTSLTSAVAGGVIHLSVVRITGVSRPECLVGAYVFFYREVYRCRVYLTRLFHSFRLSVGRQHSVHRQHRWLQSTGVRGLNDTGIPNVCVLNTVVATVVALFIREYRQVLTYRICGATIDQQYFTRSLASR